MKIYSGVPLSPSERQHLLALLATGFGAAEVQLVDSDQGRATFAQCNMAFGRFPFEWLAHPNALRWVQLDSVGFDDLLPHAEALRGAGIAVTNLQGFFADPVAETVVAGVLSIYRGLPQLLAFQSQRRWQKMEVRPQLRTLRDANVLLAGYGSIARRVEELFRPYACSMRALSSGRKAADLSLDERSFDRALPTADIVISTLPETPRTRGFFGRDRFQQMKSGTVFANVGRGGVVDEAALVDALTSRHLLGALIDVTVEEPLPLSHPLWGCPGAILTQHTAGGTHDENMRKIDTFVDNLRRFHAGEPLRGAVDFALGY